MTPARLDVAFWQEFFESLIRGGMLPAQARDRIGRASGRADEMAGDVYARWRADVDAKVEAALNGAR